jgi:alpha-tubulin suppressor-like RCC1 family protein
VAVLLADGTVRTFGANNFGQLGVNDTATRQTPVQVFTISSSATAVACGQYYTAVLLADGTVRTFGANDNGQLGVNDRSQRNTPVIVLNITTATSIACGETHTAVLLADGTVRAVGRNTNGQLGINVTGGTRQTPVQVFGISSSATVLACGFEHTIVLLANGTVQTFGQNGFGNLGLNDTVSRQTPVQVVAISATVSVTPAPTAFLTSAATSITLAATGGQIWTSSATGVARTTAGSVAGGLYHTVVVLKDGTVRTFGSNDSGELGVGDTTSRLTPVQVIGITNATAATGGGYGSTSVLLSDGTVRTFGQNNSGQLGVNDTTNRLTPVTVLNITSATAVARGYYHGAVLLADGTVRSFGNGQFGQLGVNITTSRLTPVQVFGISSSATAVACGSWHTAVLLADGSVRTFGRNDSGQLGINDTTDRSTPVQVFGISSSATAVACGYYFTAILLADGTVRTFGSNSNGQLGIDVSGGTRQTPVQVFGISSSAVAVACGDVHTTVLLADATVRTFGSNSNGRLGINLNGGSRLTPVQVSGLTSVSAIATGGQMNRSVIILADGTVRTFGFNNKGQLGVNDTVSRQTPVAVFGALGTIAYPTYVTAKGLALGLSAPTFQLDLSTDKARKLSTTTWTTGSDSRIKSDIQSANLARCVDIVDSLDLKYFKWDIPGVQGVNPTDSHSLGWIAQDVKEFFPNSVRLTQDYGFDDFHNLDSDQLIKTMYGALKKMCRDTYGDGAQ